MAKAYDTDAFIKANAAARTISCIAMWQRVMQTPLPPAGVFECLRARAGHKHWSTPPKVYNQVKAQDLMTDGLP